MSSEKKNVFEQGVIGNEVQTRKHHQLQMRFPGESVSPGMELSFQGKQYVLGDIMPQTLARRDFPVGVVVNGYTKQFKLLRDNRCVGAAWFYFYAAMEQKTWGVLDEMEVRDEGGDVA